MTENHWAELRQVGLATLDHEAAVRAATELLELGPGFGDPLLADWHLADFTAPIGPDTYLEILAPTTPGHSIARWLGRMGGASGWVLSAQVPSLDGVTERAAERGVRIAVQTRAMGHDIIQLHPLDAGVRAAPAAKRPQPRRLPVAFLAVVTLGHPHFEPSLLPLQRHAVDGHRNSVYCSVP